MADGTTTPISDIDLGDKVLATDPDTGETTSQTATTLWIHDDTVINLELDNGATITTTDHPFWNHTDQQWQPAEALDTGDQLHTTTSENITVDGINPATAHTDTAYNLTITSIHTYYVLAGNTPVLVHNTCGPNVSTRSGQIADQLGYSTREIKDAIHAVKRDGMPRGGAQRNPDVVVDLDTGEVYVKLPDGSPSNDSIGNVFDYLRER